jgi:hypothetical protein
MEPDLPQSRQGAKVFYSSSLSLRLISLWLNRHQVQGFGSCPLRATISRPWQS